MFLPILSVRPSDCPLPILRPSNRIGNPQWGGGKKRRVWKNLVNIAIYLGGYSDYETLIESHRSVSVPVTFIDLDGREPEGQNFVADLRNYARMVLSIMTEFGVVTHVVEKHSSRGPETPTSQGAGPQRPQIFDSDVNKTKFLRPRARPRPK